MIKMTLRALSSASSAAILSSVSSAPVLAEQLQTVWLPTRIAMLIKVQSALVLWVFPSAVLTVVLTVPVRFEFNLRLTKAPTVYASPEVQVPKVFMFISIELTFILVN